MIPIALDPTQTSIGLIGKGALAVRRLEQLRQLGCAPDIFCPDGDDALAREAGPSLRRRLPTRKDLKGLQVVWIVGLIEEDSARITADARAEKTLVNVEDQVPFCDFHTPAIVQRGQLVLAASTGGASPAAAKLARETLERAFPPDWENAIDELAKARILARAQNFAASAINAEAHAILARRGLIPPLDQPPIQR
jgi:precorrin-2 dehydrogenase/sirohydrochlorin ferrochelatase